jgi:hypothetical protein
MKFSSIFQNEKKSLFLESIYRYRTDCNQKQQMINLLSSCTLVRFLLISCLWIDLGKCNITWTGNSAISCDFVNDDLSNARTSSQDCSQTCNATIECTHFTWTTWNGGTCWMKKGIVCKDDAFLSSEPSIICGVITDEDYSQLVFNTTTSIAALTTTTVASQTQLTSLSYFLLFVVLLFRFFDIFLSYD